MPVADVFKTITGTERERALKRDGMPACGVCHTNFDPFGLMTQDYDAIGHGSVADHELGARRRFGAERLDGWQLRGRHRCHAVRTEDAVARGPFRTRLLGKRVT